MVKVRNKHFLNVCYMQSTMLGSLIYFISFNTADLLSLSFIFCLMDEELRIQSWVRDWDLYPMAESYAILDIFGQL